jgi:hypothetical protein
MSSPKDCSNWVILTVQRRVKMVNELIWLTGSLRPKRIIKLKTDLMCAMNESVIWLIYLKKSTTTIIKIWMEYLFLTINPDQFY